VAQEHSLAEIVDRLGGHLAGDGAIRVNQVAALAGAAPGQIAFLANPKFRRQLAATAASAVIVAPAAAAEAAALGLPHIVSDNPYAYYARVAALLNPAPAIVPGVDQTARVGVGAMLAPSCRIDAYVSIGADVRLGERVVVHAGCVIGDGVEVGDDGILYPNVVIYAGCRVGRRAIIHAGAVIGSDGFGFAREARRWVKIPQLGRVLIGDDVEIGANTTIDRGALDDTIIGDGVKLDNQIQVAHNVVIGDDSALAGCVGIAGSAKIGRRCQLAGAAMISGHLEIPDDTVVSAGTMVTKTLTKPGQYTGAYPTQEHDVWLRNAAQLKHLDALACRLRELEEKLSALEKK